MQNRMEILTSEAIAERAAAIGVPISKLAVEAGLAASTSSRWRTGGGSTLRTLRAVQRVLEARERALLQQLMQLHPDLVEREAA